MVRVLKILNTVLGGAVLLLGYGAFLVTRNPVALLLAIALTIVGPLEDWLMGKYVKASAPRSETEQAIDLGTSLGFLVFLLAAVVLVL